MLTINSLFESLEIKGRYNILYGRFMGIDGYEKNLQLALTTNKKS